MMQQDKSASPPMLFTPTAAAKHMGLSKTKFYKEVNRHLDRVPIGNTDYITRESIDRFVSERLKSAPDE